MSNIFLVLIFLQHHFTGYLALKKLSAKILNFFKEKKNPRTHEFISSTGIEYPGKDENALAKIDIKWKKYYECLRVQFADLGPQKSITPEALITFEGSYVRLDCKACINPSRYEQQMDTVWMYSTFPPNLTLPVEYGEHVLSSPDDNTLHIYNLNKESTGQYFCAVGNTVTASYFLEVVGNSEPIVLVKPDEAPYGLHKQPATELDIGLTIFTSWDRWTKCSKCGEVGRKTRAGFCTLRLTNTTAFSKINSQLKFEVSLFHLFKKGIPCRSFLLSKYFQDLPQIKMRRSEIMIKFCKERCITGQLFQIIDNQGKILETANNSAGVYSFLQGIPPTPPPVDRINLFDTTDAKIVILKCPGNLNANIPIQWKIASSTLYPKQIKIQTRGRIYVNLRNFLIIRKPREADSNIYSCWQGNELAGTIRLVIMKKIKLSWNHHILLLGTVLILGTFIIIFYKVFKGRNRS